MTIHHRTKYRTHMLNEAVVAQQIIRGMKGCPEWELESILKICGWIQKPTRHGG